MTMSCQQPSTEPATRMYDFTLPWDPTLTRKLSFGHEGSHFGFALSLANNRAGSDSQDKILFISHFAHHQPN
jgi:hypothetical protein